MNTYYKDQFDKIKANDLGYPAQVKITKDGKATHWLSLNDESASHLVKWLNDNFVINYEIANGITTIQDLEDKGEITKAY